jgi:antirestriction protein ArdC
MATRKASKPRRKSTAAAADKSTVHDIITERIVAMLEEGTAPWRKPWHAATNGPRNLVSNRPYSGINTFLLLASGYSSPYWMTYKQATDLGGNVRQGEHSTLIVFAKRTEYQDKDEPEVTRSSFTYRYYRVFNLEQTENVRLPKHAQQALTVAPSQSDAIAAADAIAAGYANGPRVREDGTAAFYRPSTDEVTLPPRESFESLSGFHATKFHELGHSTGHKDRCNRPEFHDGAVFGSHAYGREELVAEMTAAFLCAEAGILPATIENSAAYLDSWVRTIKADPKAVITAASQASKAAKRILGEQAEAEQAEAA